MPKPKSSARQAARKASVQSPQAAAGGGKQKQAVDATLEEDAMVSDGLVPTFSPSDNARKAVWLWWFEVSLNMIQSADFVKYTCPNDGDGIFVAMNLQCIIPAPPNQGGTILSKVIKLQCREPGVALLTTGKSKVPLGIYNQFRPDRKDWLLAGDGDETDIVRDLDDSLKTAVAKALSVAQPECRSGRLSTMLAPYLRAGHSGQFTAAIVAALGFIYQRTTVVLVPHWRVPILFFNELDESGDHRLLYGEKDGRPRFFDEVEPESFGSTGGVGFERLAKLILEDRTLTVVEHTGSFLFDGIEHVFAGNFNAWVSAEREKQKRGEEADTSKFPDIKAMVDAAVASIPLPTATVLAQSGYAWLRQTGTSSNDQGTTIVSRSEDEELRGKIIRHKIMTAKITGVSLRARKQQVSRSTAAVQVEAHAAATAQFHARKQLRLLDKAKISVEATIAKEAANAGAMHVNVHMHNCTYSRAHAHTHAAVRWYTHTHADTHTYTRSLTRCLTDTQTHARRIGRGRLAGLARISPRSSRSNRRTGQPGGKDCWNATGP